MNAGSLPHVDEVARREHQRRISLAIERYRRWCEEQGLPWTVTDEERKSA